MSDHRMGEEGVKGSAGLGGLLGMRWGRVGVYLQLIPAGVGRAGDCIYINMPLKQLRLCTEQQRLVSHILMAAAAPRRLRTVTEGSSGCKRGAT